MNSSKQNTNPKPKNRMGRFRAIIGKLAKLFGILFVVLLIVYLVFYFVFWPKHDRERFAEAEQIVEGRIVSLGVQAEDIQKAYTCARNGQKYIPGRPFCYFEHSFAYDDDAAAMARALGKFGGGAPGTDSHAFTLTLGGQKMYCLLESSSHRGKFGPRDLYTVHCSSGVAHDVYN